MHGVHHAHTLFCFLFHLFSLAMMILILGMLCFFLNLCVVLFFFGFLFFLGYLDFWGFLDFGGRCGGAM